MVFGTNHTEARSNLLTRDAKADMTEVDPLNKTTSICGVIQESIQDSIPPLIEPDSDTGDDEAEDSD